MPTNPTNPQTFPEICEKSIRTPAPKSQSIKITQAANNAHITHIQSLATNSLIPPL